MNDHALRVYDSILGLLSGPDNPTPLVRLNRVSPFKETQVYGKLEWYNPFGAVRIVSQLTSSPMAKHATRFKVTSSWLSQHRGIRAWRSP